MRARSFILGLCAAAAPLCGPVHGARAADVWLWVCHGPDGQPLSTLGQHAAPSGSATAGCASSDPSDGLRAAPSTGTAGWTFQMPFDALLDAVRITRTVALSEGQSYRLRAAGPLESTSPLAGTQTFAASGPQVAFEVACEATCAEGGATASSLAFRVVDSTSPVGAVAGWRSPAAQTLSLSVSARDVGLGLRSAAAFLDGRQVSSAAFGDGACADLSPQTDTIDLPFGLVAQNDNQAPDGTITPVGCAGFGTVTLPVDTEQVVDTPEGAPPDHRVTVTVTDLAGNTTTVLDAPTEVRNHVPQGSNVQTLSIGSSAAATPAEQPKSSGAVAGASAGSCLRPQLSMALASKPLRQTKTAVVLAYKRKYRFAGRLTCLVNGTRKSAVRGTRIEIFNTVGKRTTRQTTAKVGAAGAISITLAYKSSRTLVFRYTLDRNVRSQVQIKVQVVRALPRRTAIRGRWFRYVVPSAFVRFVTLEADNVPKGATVEVRCTGGGCPSLPRRGPLSRPRPTLSVIGGLAGHDLAPGAGVDVTITKPGYQGIGKVYCVRRGQKVQTKPYLVGASHPRCGLN